MKGVKRRRRRTMMIRRITKGSVTLFLFELDAPERAAVRISRRIRSPRRTPLNRHRRLSILKYFSTHARWPSDSSRAYRLHAK